MVDVAAVMMGKAIEKLPITKHLFGTNVKQQAYRIVLMVNLQMITRPKFQFLKIIFAPTLPVGIKR